MCSVQSITTQLQTQSLADSAQTQRHDSVASSASKMRHHSEPFPPRVHIADGAKKVKIITFQGVDAMSPFVFSTADEDNSTPSKRTCRSLSIPNDGELRNKWMQRNRLHRPLAVRPLSGGARSKGRSHGRLSVGLYDRASPDSPHSRPSSASSGFFDSPHISSSNLNKKRCESLHTLPTFDFEPNINFTNIVQVCKSMPSVADCSQGNSHRLERCLSQPCVSKRTGVKRRIDDVFKRPSINFSKQMAEVSNEDPSCQVTSAQMIEKTSRVLQTIASSPETLVTGRNSQEKLAAKSRDYADDADSGCSSSDEELCDITNTMTCTESARGPPFAPYTEDSVMFCLDTDLDIEMIENN